MKNLAKRLYKRLKDAIIFALVTSCVGFFIVGTLMIVPILKALFGS